MMLKLSKDIISEHDKRLGKIRDKFFDIYFFVANKFKGDGKVTYLYCGRRLTDDLSRLRGCGPVCLLKYGAIAGR